MIKWLGLLLISFCVMAAESELEREKKRLQQISKFMLEREHARKMIMLDMDSISCGPSKDDEDEPGTLMEKIERITKQSLSMEQCNKKIEERLRPYDEKIRAAKEGKTDIPENDLLVYRVGKIPEKTDEPSFSINENKAESPVFSTEEKKSVIPTLSSTYTPPRADEKVVFEDDELIETPDDETQAGEKVVSKDDEKRQRIIDYYRRNKYYYRPDDEDNLFQIISKAYFRNLHQLQFSP